MINDKNVLGGLSAKIQVGAYSMPSSLGQCFEYGQTNLDPAYDSTFWRGISGRLALPSRIDHSGQAL